jgi:hypothetical protein
MPEELDSFQFTRRKNARVIGKYDSILDEKVWKVLPSEFGFDDDDLGVTEFIKKVKYAAKVEKGRYILYNVLGNNHVVLQMQPADYIDPMWKARNAKKRKGNEE